MHRQSNGDRKQGHMHRQARRSALFKRGLHKAALYIRRYRIINVINTQIADHRLQVFLTNFRSRRGPPGHGQHRQAILSGHDHLIPAILTARDGNNAIIALGTRLCLLYQGLERRLAGRPIDPGFLIPVAVTGRADTIGIQAYARARIGQNTLGAIAHRLTPSTVNDDPRIDARPARRTGTYCHCCGRYQTPEMLQSDPGPHSQRMDCRPTVFLSMRGL